MLRVSGLEGFYGASQALFGMDFAIDAGEVVTLMGRNGMGKTTTVHAIMGLLPARRGSVEFEGQRVDHLPAFRIARLGFGLVPEGRQIFPNLSVRENLVAASANRTARANPWTLARVFEFFPRLRERQGNRGNQLSGGEQQMLAIGRALMLNPKLLLLDEPLEGLAPVIVEELCAAIARMAGQGMAILLVEQHAELALHLTSQTLVLERGRVVHQGASAELLADRASLQRLVGVRGGANSERMPAHV